MSYVDVDNNKNDLAFFQFFYERYLIPCIKRGNLRILYKERV